MFVMMIAIVSCNLASEQVVWTRERSSHWWEDVVCSSFSSEQCSLSSGKRISECQVHFSICVMNYDPQ